MVDSKPSKSKKRSAPSQGGPPSKKAHVSKSTANQPAAPIKKRARPVVLAAQSESDESDPDEELVDEGNGVAEGDSMDVDETQLKPAKDPNAAKESHKAQKVLLEQRRAAKPHSALLTQAKETWALARQNNIPKAEREKHVAALMTVIRGKVQEIVFKHDASRIVQTAVKWGTQKQRDEIAAELKGRYKELAENKYSKFLVTKLARLCPKHRLAMILEFQPHVLRLVLHREATRAVADIYELYANAYERALLLRPFYGRETALFDVKTGTKEDQERARSGLKGVLEGADAERRKRVLSALKENLLNIFNNPDKGSVRHAIVHKALLEYLTAVNETEGEAEQQRLRLEMLESCQELLAEIVHTKEGSRVVREFLAQGSAKDRKQIIKTLKPYIETMATDDEAQLVLFTALDVTDDTKLLAKSLLPTITSNSSKLYSAAAGRRTLLYPFIPRVRRHYTPALVASLAETDPIREHTSKKAADIRIAEVRASASPDLLAWIEKDGAEVSRDTGGSLVVTEVMLEADGEKQTAMEALLKPLATPLPSAEPSRPHPIDLPHTSRMYKTLLQGGHFSQTRQAVERSPRFSASAFASAFLKIVGKDTTLAMARGDGVFVVSELLERVHEDGSDAEKTILREWFKGFLKSNKAKEEVKGWKVLVDKVKKL
ncbi:ARM repeat-containing protein [Auriscalpium vulgare]|uniref:ARM repeat-containing protein n=1 Tax=Auriscalpium vulgare TaxID=40419 RepID=A0ACB8RNX4_9AGAM|nr:ARM repeat-containing protein [Auriscalpium vulgare]